MSAQIQYAIDSAAAVIADAEALLVTAGAGMGVDSGLPDFRGNEGFWKAYPALKAQGIQFTQIARPSTFVKNPAMAWAFYGHRQKLYRETAPHAGYAEILKWCDSGPLNYFVYTSNVDMHFQRAGFDEQRVFECHGNIFLLQCIGPCSRNLWRADDLHCGEENIPTCPECGEVARPNVLMFADFTCLPDSVDEQYARYQGWLREIEGKRVVVIEIGAGSTIPTVRRESEWRSEGTNGTLVRINPTEANAPPGSVSIALPALEAISRIANSLK